MSFAVLKSTDSMEVHDAPSFPAEMMAAYGLGGERLVIIDRCLD